MKIHYATTNSGKVTSLQRVCDSYQIEVLQVSLDIPEPRSNDVQEIAHEKVTRAYEIIKKPVVVMDAGFYIHALGGFPRAYVNFALETIGIEGMLKLVEGKERACEFRECMAYLDKTLSEPQFFVGCFPGRLADKPRGTRQPYTWSPLWFIFIPEGQTQTLAEMSEEQYLAWHQREIQKNVAEKLFVEWLLAPATHSRRTK